MQRYWFLDVMFLKQRSKAKTVSSASWDARGHLPRMRTTGIQSAGAHVCECDLPSTHHQNRRPGPGGTNASSSERGHRRRSRRKELPPMEPPAMCYMMSKQGHGGDSAPHWPSHLMFFFSDTDPAVWGANLPGSPVVGISAPLEHLTQFVIPTQRWSEGTEDLPSSPIHVHQ